MTQLKSFQLNRISPLSGNKKILTIVMDGVGYTNPNANITSELKNQKGLLPSEAFNVRNKELEIKVSKFGV